MHWIQIKKINENFETKVNISLGTMTMGAQLEADGILSMNIKYGFYGKSGLYWYTELLKIKYKRKTSRMETS